MYATVMNDVMGNITHIISVHPTENEASAEVRRLTATEAPNPHYAYSVDEKCPVCGHYHDVCKGRRGPCGEYM